MRRKERRKVQRVRFAKPLVGRVRARKVAVLDLSTQGACVEHQSSLTAGTELQVEIDWNDTPIRIDATITRCTLSHYTSGTKPVPVYHSGVSFRSMDDASREALVSLIEHYLRLSIAEGRELGGGSLPAEIGGMPIEVWLRNKLK